METKWLISRETAQKVGVLQYCKVDTIYYYNLLKYVNVHWHLVPRGRKCCGINIWSTANDSHVPAHRREFLVGRVA